MAAARRPGPAPIASFDHDVSDESSPETKQTFQLPEIREDSWSVGRGSAGAGASGAGRAEGALAPPERARSHSTPGLGGAAPRIDISRASSSSHHDSRDSSPELALFAGCAGAGEESRARLELGFREDGALELRSSTEELAFLQGAPGGPPAPPAPPAPRLHSRKDSQGSEAALLAVSGRTSRISSVGSHCSAQSGASRVSRLSVASGASRSPSPHRMLLETSFCGPKPIETDPEACAAAVEECLLEIARLTAPDPADSPAVRPETEAEAAPDARDRREVRTEVTVESARPAPRAPLPPEKSQKETRNQQRQARSRERREPGEPEVHRTRNKSKDIIRIKLKPSEEYDDDDDCEEEKSADAARAARPTELPQHAAARDAPRRSPSPAGAPVSRKSSFCSLFKSRETIGSPDSPSDALRRKKSLHEGRSRSKSRERSATPSSAGKLRGSVLSLFRTPRRAPASPATSPSPAHPLAPPLPGADRLKYYEDSTVIHIPLRTPPDERAGSACAGAACEAQPPRPASAPQPRAAPPPPTRRTVLPDGSVIIPLHSPTDPSPPRDPPAPGDGTHGSRDSQRGVTAAVVEPRPATSASLPLDGTSPAQRTPTPPAQTGPLSTPGDRSETSRSPETTGTTAAPAPHTDRGSQKRRERLVFTTHVGSAEQIFSTQFSLTKTPSVTSEISESLASFAEERCGAGGGGVLRDTRIATPEPAPGARAEPGAEGGDPARDSSESEGSTEAAGARAAGAGDAEARGLVVEGSFEDELPYVPTTLPLERPLALPMVPIRERGSLLQSLAMVERPRAASVSLTQSVARMPAPPPAPPPARDKLRVRLPRRNAPPEQGVAGRHAAGAGAGGEAEGARRQWVDFAEVPERRQPAKRIETLPPPAAPIFSYVEPAECRCECHAQAPPAAAAAPAAPLTPDDEQPLLREDAPPSRSQLFDAHRNRPPLTSPIASSPSSTSASPPAAEAPPARGCAHAHTTAQSARPH